MIYCACKGYVSWKVFDCSARAQRHDIHAVDAEAGVAYIAQLDNVPIAFRCPACNERQVRGTEGCSKVVVFEMSKLIWINVRAENLLDETADLYTHVDVLRVPSLSERSGR